MRILRKIRRKCKRIKIPLSLTFIILILIFAFVMLQKPTNNKFIGNNCKTCKITVSDIRFEEINQSHEYLHFNINNQNTKAGNCLVEIDIKKEDIILSNFTHEIGIIQPRETISEKVIVVPPEGETEFSITPYCSWLG